MPILMQSGVNSSFLSFLQGTALSYFVLFLTSLAFAWAEPRDFAVCSPDNMPVTDFRSGDMGTPQLSNKEPWALFVLHQHMMTWVLLDSRRKILS